VLRFNFFKANTGLGMAEHPIHVWALIGTPDRTIILLSRPKQT
jgi:hypothetical protein